VNAELEARRKDKVFGTSLGGSVQVTASGDDLALLRKYEDSLPMLFIVSAVAVSEGAAGSPTAIAVTKADGVKCQRCWRIVPSVAGEGDREGLCSRCVEALAEPVSP
jgi:isoleucyl-tRNA synthetase